MTTTWTIAIDWDRNDDFSDTDDEVTNFTLNAQWFLGMRQRFQDDADDSVLELTLHNGDRRFSPENAFGPLFGKIAPLRPVRVQSNDGTTTRTHWLGWIESIESQVSPTNTPTVKIVAAGPMQFLKAAETQIELQENQRTDAIIERLIREVIAPPALNRAWVLGTSGYGELDVTTYVPDTELDVVADVGTVTLAIAADNWVTRSDNRTQATFNVYRAIADVVAAERGRFVFDRDGRAVFWNRLHFQDDVAVAGQFEDGLVDVVYDYAALPDFRNEVTVVAHPRMASGSATDVLWELSEPVTLPAGKTLTLTVRFQDAENSSLRIGAKEVFVDEVVFDTTTGGIGDESGGGVAAVNIEAKANSAILTLINHDPRPATLIRCVVRGRKITDFGQMESTARDAESITFYGRRSLKINIPSIDKQYFAQYVADYEVKRRGRPQGMIEQVRLISHSRDGGGYHGHQLARTLGDVITVFEQQTGHENRRYAIIGEKHHLTHEQLETTWYLEPIQGAPFPWKLGVAGRSELDSTTIPAF